MKIIVNILFSAVLFMFIGCDTTTTNPEDGNVQYNVIPAQEQGVGFDYNITSYFFPYNTLINSYAYKDYLVTKFDANGYMTNQKTIVKHYLEGNENGAGGSIISVFENNVLIRKSIVEVNYIFVYTYDKNGISTGSEQYTQLIRVNEDLLRNENGACVLREQIDNFSISSVVPLQSNPQTNSAQDQYGNVLHFYCGTSNGIKIDRYYADGYGEIIEKHQYTDGSIEYSVYDKNTDQIP